MPAISDYQSLLKLVQQNFAAAGEKNEGWLMGLTSPSSTLGTIIAKLQTGFHGNKQQEQKYITNFHNIAVKQNPPYPAFYLNILEKLTTGDLNGAIREYVIHLLQQRFDYNQHYQKDADKTTGLQTLINQLSKDKSTDWLAAFNAIIAADAKLKALVSNNGHTGKLLKYIQDQDFSKAEQMIAKQQPVSAYYFAKVAHTQQLPQAPQPAVAQQLVLKPTFAARPPNTQRVFSVGDNINDQTTKVLATHFYAPKTEIVVETLRQNSQHQALRVDELNSLVCLGHADQETYGDFKADAFVTKLSTLVNQQDRAQLKHLYLIGCELGLLDDKGQSLAQSIADKLLKAGFTQVKIHSVAKPYAHLPGTEAMFVHVLDHVGIASVATGVRLGYIYADLHTQAAQKEILTIEKELKKTPQKNVRALHEQLRAISKDPQKTFHFLAASHPKTTLDRTENTFIPGEGILKRNQRIAAAYQTTANSDKSKVINFLSQRATHQAKKKDKEKEAILKFIISELEKTSNDAECHEVLIDLKSKIFEVKCLGIDWLGIINKRSRTYKLIEALCQGNIDEAQRIMVYQQQKDNHATPTPPQTTELLVAKQAITAFQAVLDAERAALKERGISFLHPFNAFTYTTKTKKRELLQTLLDTNDLTALQNSVAHVFQNQKKYSRELNDYHTRRTVDLLEAIQNNNITQLNKIKDDYLAHTAAAAATTTTPSP